MAQSTLSIMAKEIYDLRQEKDKINSQLSELNKKLDAAEKRLIEEMQHEDLTRVDLAGCASFTIATSRRFKIADRDAFMKHIHENELDDMLTVNHHTLNAYAKELLEQKEASGEKDYKIPGLGWYSEPAIRVRKHS